MAKRLVKTFEHSPVEHVIESETVDYDNRTFAFTVFGHEDPNVVTVMIGTYMATLSRDAMREGFARLQDALEKVPHVPKGVM